MAKQAVSSTSAVNSTPTHDEIAAQAYQIYLREGCAEGRDLDHWLRAEEELRERVTHAESNGQQNGNGARVQQPSAPRAVKQQEQSSVLTNNVVPPSAPITEVNRGTTPRRNSGKREAAAAAK